jgi:hypothetical protein
VVFISILLKINNFFLLTPSGCEPATRLDMIDASALFALFAPPVISGYAADNTLYPFDS